MRVLLIEDDSMIGEAVRRGLRQDGIAVDWVRDGDAGMAALAAHGGHGAIGAIGADDPYDLLLLDLGLPRRDGLDVLRDARRRGLDLPVLIITARDAVADRIAGLDAGADDYLLKPFDLDELAARMRALQRRRSGRAEPLIVHGDLVLNPASHEAHLGGVPVALSAREFALLQVLLEHPGMVYSKAQLEDRLYGWGEEIGSNTIEVYIHALRKKLGGTLIRNVRGVGYTIPRPA